MKFFRFLRENDALIQMQLSLIGVVLVIALAEVGLFHLASLALPALLLFIPAVSIFFAGNIIVLPRLLNWVIEQDELVFPWEEGNANYNIVVRYVQLAVFVAYVSGVYLPGSWQVAGFIVAFVLLAGVAQESIQYIRMLRSLHSPSSAP